MHSSRFPAAPALALVLTLAACGEDVATPSATETATPSATATATATASASPTATPETWQRITVDQSGFSLEVPADWEELSADVLADEALLADLAERNPDAASVLEQGQEALENGTIAVFAFDPNAGDAGFAANLNVINVGPVAESIEEAAESVAAAIEQQIPVTGPIEVDTTALPAGDAATVTYEWEIARPDGGATPVTVVQYAIVVDSGTGFILSMSAATDDVGGYDETFRHIAESFRELDS